MRDREDRYVAINTAVDSGNEIHAGGAAAYGFRGGLVPGINLLAYVCESLREAGGEHWIERGQVALSYVAPVYDRDTICVRIRGARHGVDIELVDSSAVPAARGTAAIGPSGYAGRRPSLPRVPVPAERAEMSGRGMVGREMLGTTSVRLGADEVVRSMTEQGLDPGWYVERGTVPLAAIAQSYFALADVNFVRVGPGILAGNTLLVVRAPRLGEALSVRGRIDRLFSRGGRDYAAFELGWFDADDEPCVWGLHTSIYSLR